MEIAEMPAPGLTDESARRWQQVADRLHWGAPWEAVFEPGERGGRWFPGGTLNVAENCLDRHLPVHAQKVALYWEGEPGDRRALTYEALHREVCAFADALRALGVGAGDRVALYMGLIPETVVAMLACARLGAVHTVIAASLPADALADRLADFRPKVVVTQDGSWRHGVILPLKARADEAISAATGIEHTVVVRRTGIDVAWYEGDYWYDELLSRPRPRANARGEALLRVPSDQPLLVVYIANKRGLPTGIVHGSGGFLAYTAATHTGVLAEAPDDIVWVIGEIAWVAAQSHGVYGPLACGGTSVLYEGMLDTPTQARCWEIIERYRVNSLLTTQPVLRSLHTWVDSRPCPGQLESVRAVVAGGEPRDPELQEWIRAQLRPGAIVADAWGQAETGGITCVSQTPPAAEPLPWPYPEVVDVNGSSAGNGVKGELVLHEPWPGTFIGFHNDDPDAAARIWERYEGVFATGDRAVREPEGWFVFLGRIDLMATVCGHIVSLTEVCQALLEHPFVRDAVIVEQADPRAGQWLAACVVLTGFRDRRGTLAQDLRNHVRERLGGLVQPRTIAFVESFPEELDDDVRRQALRMLCAAASGPEICISTEELRAVARGHAC